VKGPIATASIVHRNRYIFGLIESKSRYLVQFFIHHKDDVFESIKTFVKVYVDPIRVLNPTLQRVYIHSDRGEFNKQEIRDYLYTKAIFTTVSCAYMSPHNGVIERLWRSITDASICSLLLAELGEEFWEEARKCAGYVYNRIRGAHYGEHPQSPYEQFWGIKPKIRHLRIFGCLVYVMIELKRKGHGEKAEPGYLMGYEDRTPLGYRVYLYKKRKFITTYRLTFVENPNGQPESVTTYDDVDVDKLIMQHNTSSTELEADGVAVECSIDGVNTQQEFTMGEVEVSAVPVGEQVEESRSSYPGVNPSQYQNLDVIVDFIDGAGVKVIPIPETIIPTDSVRLVTDGVLDLPVLLERRDTLDTVVPKSVGASDMGICNNTVNSQETSVPRMDINMNTRDTNMDSVNTWDDSGAGGADPRSRYDELDKLSGSHQIDSVNLESDMDTIHAWPQSNDVDTNARPLMSSSNETNNPRVCALPNNLPVCTVEEPVRGSRDGNTNKSFAIEVENSNPIFTFPGNGILTNNNVSTTEITPKSIIGWSEHSSTETERMGACHLELHETRKRRATNMTETENVSKSDADGDALRSSCDVLASLSPEGECELSNRYMGGTPESGCIPCTTHVYDVRDQMSLAPGRKGEDVDNLRGQQGEITGTTDLDENDTPDLSTTLESQKSRRKLNHGDSIRDMLHNQVDEPVTNFYESERVKWGYAAACTASVGVPHIPEKVETGRTEISSVAGLSRSDASHGPKYVSDEYVRTKESMGISPVGDPTDAKRYRWLHGTRHIDDDDHYMYEVVQIDWSKRLRVPVIRRQRVTRFGVLEDAGHQGWIQAEYAAMLTRAMSNRTWVSRYKRLTFGDTDKTHLLGVRTEKMIRRGEVVPETDLVVTDGMEKRTLYHLLSTAAEYGDILSVHALTANTVQVDIRVPTTHKQVLRSPQREHWLEAERAEMESFKENQVMVPCWVPNNKKALRTKWIYTAKYDLDGKLKKYKARLVARGFEQIFGVDFEETFSPVTRLTSLRLLLALSAQLGLVTHQMDVKTAFLNAELDEETYIDVPEGVTPDVPCNGFQLKRALYGLKQSPRAWNKNINEFLLSLGFVSLPNEPCLYSRREGDKISMIALYVDDLVISGSTLDIVQEIKARLSERYSMSDLGEVGQILGCEVKREGPTGRLTLTQRSYIRQLIAKLFPNIVLQSVQTPSAVQTYLSKSMCPTTPADIEFMRLIPYREAVGSLLWLASGTRPDIAYAVSQVARFCENPGKEHWEAVQRIFRYLVGTMDYGLQYSSSDQLLRGQVGCHSFAVPRDDPLGAEVADAFLVYSDSDHGRCRDTRRSVTGFVFYLAGAPICWQSRQQPTVALSSMEAEYMAACATTQEALWLVALLKALGFQQSRPVKIQEDNQSAIAYSKNPTNHKYTKHIDTRYHFVREQVAANVIELQKVPSADNVADVLTKPLAAELHWNHTNAMLTLMPSDSNSLYASVIF